MMKTMKMKGRVFWTLCLWMALYAPWAIADEAAAPAPAPAAAKVVKRQRGGSAEMEINKAVSATNNKLAWFKAGTPKVTVVTCTTTSDQGPWTPAYENGYTSAKASVNTKTGTLTLLNLADKDAGNYTAEFTADTTAADAAASPVQTFQVIVTDGAESASPSARLLLLCLASSLLLVF